MLKNLAESFFARGSLGQFARYLVSGAVSFGLEYGIFLLLYKAAGFWYIPANSAAMCAGFATSFLLNRYWSFKSRDRLLKQLVLYGTLFVLNLMLSNLGMYLLAGAGKMPAALAKILMMGLIILWNFVIYKKIIYKK